MLLTEQTITCGGNPYPQLETSPQLHEGTQIRISSKICCAEQRLHTGRSVIRELPKKKWPPFGQKLPGQKACRNIRNGRSIYTEFTAAVGKDVHSSYSPPRSRTIHPPSTVFRLCGSRLCPFGKALNTKSPGKTGAFANLPWRRPTFPRKNTQYHGR